MNCILLQMRGNLKKLKTPYKSQILVLVGLLFILILALACTDSIDKSPFVVQDFDNDITDTIGKGTGIEILGGSIKSSSASVGFRFKIDKSNNYKVSVLLGKNESTYIYEETVNRPPYNFIGGVTNVFLFEDLDANETYYATIRREKETVLGELRIKFKTLGLNKL